ncbi:MAG: DNA polymerase beta superfamily protein [Opitutaceae bacterium]
MIDRTRIVFESIVGSHAYGTQHANSDEDIKGIFIEPMDSLLTLTELPEQINDAKGDIVYYSLRRFLELALSANPNIVELLFMPEDCVRTVAPCFRPIIEQRDLFITKQAYVSHVRYAQSQIRKAKGQNKWVNNPQPEQPPTRLDFCWFVPNDVPKNEAPLRPKTLEDAGINLAHCHVASMEHTPNVFRLYHYGSSAKGVFRGKTLTCEPIPIEDETTHCIGLLIFNEQAYTRAKKDHQNYWTWRAQRNERRWETQENGQIDYDAKNMMHMFRLMLSAENILEHGAPIVRFEGETLAFLKEVLAGAFSHTSLLGKADTLSKRLDALYDSSTLPEQPDAKRAESLLKQVTSDWENQYARTRHTTP